MGWSSAGTAVSVQILSLYDKGCLTKDVLESIMKPYLNSDCDTDTFWDTAKDGKDVHEIICSVMLPEEYRQVREKLIFDDSIEEEYKNFANSNNGLDLFYKVWRDIWKMW